MIELLAITCFIAIAGYCLVVAWPHLRWSALTSRQPGGLRRQHVSALSSRSARQQPASVKRQAFRGTSATAGLYSKRSEEFVRRGAGASEALSRELMDHASPADRR